MNEITVHGHTGRAPRITHTSTGLPVVTFSVAVNSGYFDRARNKWISRPTVWHDVVVYGELANNAYDTLIESGKGTVVTVTGKFADDSYTKEFRDEDITINKLKLEASDVAISLVRATAAVTKKPRAAEQGAAEQGAVDSTTRTTANAAALSPAS